MNKGIYVIQNKENGKIYIGESLDLKKRKADFFSANKKKFNKKLYDDLIYYGTRAFSFRILEAFSDVSKEELIEKEKRWIKLMKSNDSEEGYNILIGGKDWNGAKHSSETLQKISESRKGKGGHGHKPVKQIDPYSNEIIKIWTSAADASRGLSGNESGRAQIGMVCNKVFKRGYASKTAMGYKWQFA